MIKTSHETLVIDESNTTDAGGGWRRIDKIETTGSVYISVNLRVRSISAGESISADESINAGGAISAGAWISAGGSISAGGPISADGSISADESINAGGAISAGAWISAGGSISAGGPISADGSISADAWIGSAGSIHAGCAISTAGSISTGGSISADESISADGSISAVGPILCRVLHWGMLSLPQCTEIVVTHAVRPPEWQREHWASRLGVDMPESDCYDEIERQYAGRLPEWLARTDLLPVERLILESHTPEARTKAEARAKELRGAIKREGKR